jgi:DNA modification methylase
MDYRIIEGDCIEGMRRLEGQSVHCCVTSPPYFGLRDYGHAAQIGLEPTPAEFVAQACRGVPRSAARAAR